MDFQRASHVLANATLNTNTVSIVKDEVPPGATASLAASTDKNKKARAAAMSMHRVSEHREEDEEDRDDNNSVGKKKKHSVSMQRKTEGGGIDIISAEEDCEGNNYSRHSYANENGDKRQGSLMKRGRSAVKPSP